MRKTRARAGAVLAFAAAPWSASAAPPLFTEDAATAPAGELEVETWLEGIREPDENLGLGIAEAALGLTDWLEVAAAGGVGIEEGPGFTVPNPYGFLRAIAVDGEGEAYPSVGAMALAVAPVGSGAAYADETAVAGLVPVTFEFGGGAIAAHGNLGVTLVVTGETETRAFWGAAAEAEIPGAPVVALGEVMAGDPYDPAGPRAGAQTGLVWEVADAADVDLALAAMADPDEDDLEWIGRLGVSFGIEFWNGAAGAGSGAG